MQNPQIKTIPSKQWTLIDGNNQGGFLHLLKFIKGRYLWTYRTPGSSAPTLRSDGAPLFYNSVLQEIKSTDAKAIYVWADNPGRIRLDKINTSVGLSLENVRRSAFGEILTAKNDILTGWTFPVSINPGIVDPATGTENGGSVTHSDSFAVLTTGTEIDGAAQIQTIKTSRYIPGSGGRVSFTGVWDTPKADSEQGIGLIDDENGWAFGYNGLQFGLLRRNDGVDNWTYQDAWNRDIRNVLNPQFGNVFEIKYQWLGFGAQYFSIENEAGNLAIVHIIDYANKYTSTSVGNPNLPLRAWVKNKGNNTLLTLKTPSASAGMDGDAFNEALSVTVADGVLRESVNGTDQPVISFYNSPVWLTKTNPLFVQALRLGLACDGNKPMIFKVLANAVPTDGDFAYIDEQLSAVQVNKNFTAFTGGFQIGYFPVGKSDSSHIDLVSTKFRGYPGQHITIVADTIGAQDTAVGVTIRQFL